VLWATTGEMTEDISEDDCSVIVGPVVDLADLRYDLPGRCLLVIYPSVMPNGGVCVPCKFEKVVWSCVEVVGRTSPFRLPRRFPETTVCVGTHCASVIPRSIYTVSVEVYFPWWCGWVVCLGAGSPVGDPSSLVFGVPGPVCERVGSLREPGLRPFDVARQMSLAAATERGSGIRRALGPQLYLLTVVACPRIDSAFSKNRTGSSAFVPENSGRDARAARKSSYGMSTDRSGA